MSSPTIDPAKLASIRAKQDYQQQLDAYNDAEERRLKRRANFGKQTVMGLIVFVLAMVFFSVLQLPPEYPVSLFVLTFIGGTVVLLFVSFLASSRPNKKPIEGSES